MGYAKRRVRGTRLELIGPLRGLLGNSRQGRRVVVYTYIHTYIHTYEYINDLAQAGRTHARSIIIIKSMHLLGY